MEKTGNNTEKEKVEFVEAEELTQEDIQNEKEAKLKASKENSENKDRATFVDDIRFNYEIVNDVHKNALNTFDAMIRARETDEAIVSIDELKMLKNKVFIAQKLGEALAQTQLSQYYGGNMDKLPSIGAALKGFISPNERIALAADIQNSKVDNIRKKVRQSTTMDELEKGKMYRSLELQQKRILDELIINSLEVSDRERVIDDVIYFFHTNPSVIKYAMNISVEEIREKAKAMAVSYWERLSERAKSRKAFEYFDLKNKKKEFDTLPVTKAELETENAKLEAAGVEKDNLIKNCKNEIAFGLHATAKAKENADKEKLDIPEDYWDKLTEDQQEIARQHWASAHVVKEDYFNSLDEAKQKVVRLTQIKKLMPTAERKITMPYVHKYINEIKKEHNATELTCGALTEGFHIMPLESEEAIKFAADLVADGTKKAGYIPVSAMLALTFKPSRVIFYEKQNENGEEVAGTTKMPTNPIPGKVYFEFEKDLRLVVRTTVISLAENLMHQMRVTDLSELVDYTNAENTEATCDELKNDIERMLYAIGCEFVSYTLKF